MSLSAKLGDAGIRLQSYSTGNYKIRCPKCSNERRNKSDLCLSVTINDDGAVWKCHNNCGFNGGVRDDSDIHDRVVRLPPRPPANAMQVGPLTQDAVDWFNKRHISVETLQSAGVGCLAAWIPAKQSKVPCIAFPYRIEGGKNVNVKFRSYDKEFAQVKGGEKVLYGWDRVDTSASQLVITEGEIDALSMTQAGVENAVSIPDGASDRKLEFLTAESLAGFSKIILALDADKPGEAMTEELARRFGHEKCYRVGFPDGSKDANDVLCKYGEPALLLLVDAAEPYPIAGLYGADTFTEEVLGLYHGRRLPTWSTGWYSVDPFLRIRAGDLSVVTGAPGSGKSEFIDAMCMNLAVSHNWKFAVCSFENRPEEHLAKLAEKYTGMPFWGSGYRMSEEKLLEALAWIKEHFLFIRAERDETASFEWFLERARAAVLRDGINGVVIDPYNEIEHQRPDGCSETEYVSRMLSKFKRFLQNHGVHGWFVAHPQKLQRGKDGRYPEPGLWDISGGANWSNKTDIGITVVRMDDEAGDVKIIIRKVRAKSVGRPGEVVLTYERSTGRYFDKTQQTLFTEETP